jgi:hypothetical protein
MDIAYRHDLLQRLFSEKIEHVELQDPGYSGHASDVWVVKTASEESVVRCSRLTNEPDHEFWWGCLHLFGIDPRHMVNFEKNSELLNTVPDIPAPKVLSKAELDGKEYLVVEKMRGKALESFTGQPEELLYQFGIWLAKVHRSRANFFGNIAKTSTEHKDRFHTRLAETIKIMAEREYPEDSKIRKVSGNILEELKSLPVPDWFCPIMPDMSSSQFLAEEGRISAIVDIEAYVVGPRILDFIALEYVLDKEASRPFLEGYCSMLDVPPLSGYRKVYRYFYLLLGIQGTVDLDEWMAQPELF